MIENNMVSNMNLAEVWNENIFTWHSKTYLTPIIPVISQFLVSKNINGSLLDFGCGFGEQTNVFDKLGFQAIGMDSCPQRIAQAKLDYPNIDFQQYKFTSRLPFEDNSFDIIFSNSVLQYVNHQDFLKECDRVLKKGGCLILIENLRNNPITRLGRGFLKLANHTYQSYPWNHFTLKELVDLKERFAYSKLEIFHFLTPLAYIKPLKQLFPFFRKIDSYVLKFDLLTKFGWLSLFIGQKK